MDTVKRIADRFSEVQIGLELAKAKARNELASIGTAMRAIRQEHGSGLRELAGRIGISAPFLADVELGRRSPSKEVLQKWVNAVNKCHQSKHIQTTTSRRLKKHSTNGA